MFGECLGSGQRYQGLNKAGEVSVWNKTGQNLGFPIRRESVARLSTSDNHKILPDLYLGIWSGRLGTAKTPLVTLGYAELGRTDPARRTNPDWQRSAGKSAEHSQRWPDHVHCRTPAYKDGGRYHWKGKIRALSVLTAPDSSWWWSLLFGRDGTR